MNKVHYIRPTKDSLNFAEQINGFLSQLSEDTSLIDIKCQLVVLPTSIVQSALIIYQLP